MERRATAPGSGIRRVRPALFAALWEAAFNMMHLGTRSLLWWGSLLLVIGAATVPRIGINYGMDGDAIRSVLSAEWLISLGKYWPSRLPGNPLFEHLLAAVVPFDGAWATNLFVFGFFLVSVPVFRQLTEEIPHRELTTTLFACTPIVLLNAAVTMDYVPALCMLLLSYRSAHRLRFALTWLFFGLAVGFRLSHVLFAMPLCLYFFLRGVPLRRIIIGAVAGMALGFVWYLPVLVQFGLAAFLVPADAYHGLAQLKITAYRLIMVLGPAATLGLAALFVLHARAVGRSLREAVARRDAAVAAEVSAVVLFLAVFLLHSDESEYLIPALPFLYLMLARMLPLSSLAVLAFLVFSYAVVTVDFKGGESGRRHFTVRPEAGILIRDYRDRKELEALRAGAAAFDPGAHAVVLSGYGPVLGFRNPGLVACTSPEIIPGLQEQGISESNFLYRIPGKPVFYVTGLSKDNVALLRNASFRVYYFSDSAPSHAMHSWGYDPADLGLTRLAILGKDAFYRDKTKPTQE